MTWLTILMLSMTIVMGLIFFGLFCWAVKDGQFENVEEAKYVMFREKDNEGDDFE